ncbi:hypothetical protein K493DRAFT_274567 [Basidiobolus meristosporus CBS 931.73]|uniref:Cyclin N-terminal domain-containing protein n=1 Tax=Basidiobolus meristosporus CBS 931.73 TaxID=1314790 RepID=A0A1Y1Z7W4_9FUNG|nr:hypothetical protein K493DRAFT_274567 [Basidiobolus meristosporus CBS 931.73]|eukprot:ORY06087.1 hypothetical protein K493DRAFT_274567 [Basidiobolus meristosporus CBS 931.73]
MSCTVLSSQQIAEYEPLPDPLINFTTEFLCGILNCKQRPLRQTQMPELLLFVTRVAERSRISACTGVIALIYLYRLKARLPAKAQGEYGTSHRIFLASILVASKYLYGPEGLKNKAMAEASGVFSPTEVGRMEEEFLKLLDYRVWVNDQEIQSFLEQHKSELYLI